MTALLIDPVGGTAPTDEVGDVRLPSPSEARDAPPPQQSAVPSRWAAGSRFGLMGLAAPGGVFFFSIFGEWSPAPFFTMRLGAARTLTGTVEAPSASAEMTWTAGQAEICFGHLHKGPLYVHPCLHADVGAVHARAMNEGSVTNIEPKTRPIVLGGLETRLELRTTDALFFEVALLGFASLLRPRFAFRPEVEIYRAPLVGLGGSVGGGLRF